MPARASVLSDRFRLQAAAHRMGPAYPGISLGQPKLESALPLSRFLRAAVWSPALALPGTTTTRFTLHLTMYLYLGYPTLLLYLGHPTLLPLLARLLPLLLLAHLRPLLLLAHLHLPTFSTNNSNSNSASNSSHTRPTLSSQSLKTCSTALDLRLLG